MTNIYLQLNKNIYSRKIHIILIILTFILFNTKISHAEVYKFTDKSETYLKEITLENGDVIKSIKDEKKDSYKLFQYKKQDSLAYSLEVENALVFIRGAYPSQNKAKIAIVESGGGGNCCPQHLVSILYVDNASVLKIFDIGTNYSNELSILINYTNGKLNIEVDNFSDGETDKYGDLNKALQGILSRDLLYSGTRITALYEIHKPVNNIDKLSQDPSFSVKHLTWDRITALTYADLEEIS